MSSLHIPRALEAFPNSYVLLSSCDTCDNIAVFVHGFGGRPTSTWRDFQGLIDHFGTEFPFWQNTDLFFYSYDSRRPVQVTSQDFSSFLQTVITGEIDEIAPSDFPFKPKFLETPLRWETHHYKQLHLLGHSEGAVVIRRAILDRLLSLERAARNKLGNSASATEVRDFVQGVMASDFIMNAKMDLFAPACLGTNFSSAFGFLTAYSDILNAIAASFASRNDLLPESPILTQLRAETENASKQHPAVNAFRAEVLFGENDHIVYVGGYNCDHLLPYEKEQSHTSVCKPTLSYVRPLELVA